MNNYNTSNTTTEKLKLFTTLNKYIMTDNIPPTVELSTVKFFGINNKADKTVYTVKELNDEEQKLAEFMIRVSNENDYNSLVQIVITDKEKGSSLDLEFQFTDESMFPFTIQKRKPTKYEILSEFIPLETLGYIRIVSSSK